MNRPKPKMKFKLNNQTLIILPKTVIVLNLLLEVHKTLLSDQFVHQV